MAVFIAKQIETKAEISIEEGKDKYRAYFVRTKLYIKYKADVNAILDTDGFSDCIVEM